MKKSILTMRGRHRLTGLTFVAPWLIGFLAFTLFPMAYTAFLSFNRVQQSGAEMLITWIGIENYRQIFVMDVAFIAVLTDYIRQIVVYVPLIIVFSLIIAMLLNIPGRGLGIFRTLFFLPVIIASGPVINYLTENGALYLPGNSVILNALTSSGAFPPSVMGGITFLIEAFISILWNSGLQILIFLAALQKLDVSMYEAAQIDGASRWVVFWKLTIVTLNPMIVINTLFTVVMLSVFSSNPILEKIRGDLYSPALGFGYASALTWIFFVLLVIIISIAFLITRRKER